MYIAAVLGETQCQPSFNGVRKKTVGCLKVSVPRPHRKLLMVPCKKWGGLWSAVYAAAHRKVLATVNVARKQIFAYAWYSKA